jgi:hypothetical protein
MTHTATHLNTRRRRLISFSNTEIWRLISTLWSPGLKFRDSTSCPRSHVPFMIITIISDYFPTYQWRAVFYKRSRCVFTVPQKVNLYKCNSGWAQAQVPLRVLRLSPANIISPMLHVHLHLHDAVCRRTIRRSLSNFQTNHLLPEIGRTGKKTTFVSWGQKYEDEYEESVEFKRSTNSPNFFIIT